MGNEVRHTNEASNAKLHSASKVFFWFPVWLIYSSYEDTPGGRRVCLAFFSPSHYQMSDEMFDPGGFVRGAAAAT